MSQLLNFSVESNSITAAKTEIKTRNFTFLVDEPESLGGTNLAPNPVEYILAGYAGCINVVAHITAQELGIEFRKLSINISGDLDPRRLFGTDYNFRAGYQNIHVSLDTDADVSETERKTWLQAIENRCPVNDNLQNPTPIYFSLN